MSSNVLRVKFFLAFSFLLGTCRSSPSTSRITGGVDADITEAPFAAIVERSGEEHCGGSVVHASFVLTARNCIKGFAAKDLAVRVGFTRKDEAAAGKRYAVKDVHLYPSSAYIDYDVGLLELQEPLAFSDKVKPVPLSEAEPSTGAELIVYGWGLTSWYGPLSNSLQKIAVRVVDRDACNDRFGGFITSRMICAEASGKDPCSGDNGGPAVHNGTVAGIVSFSYKCAISAGPVVYANVAYPDMLNYVKQFIGSSTDDSSNKSDQIVI